MGIRRYVLGAAGVVTLVAGVVAPTAVGASSKHRSAKSSAPVVVVSGLNNPRQLSLTHGRLLIAEAGKGGKIKFTGAEGPSFLGRTGSISAVYGPRHAHGRSPHRIVTGLMSAAGADGSAAAGSDGVTSRGRHGSIYIQETFVPPNVPPAALRRAQNGKLLRVGPSGNNLQRVVNIARFERNHDPDGKGFDSDPYAVLAVHGGLLVADAAGNDVLRVDRDGHVSVFHVFKNVRSGACAGQFDPDPAHPGCNFVPTSLATDRWGHVYVGGLSSLTPGAARVVKLSRNGHHVLKVWRGFSAVTGVAVDRHGVLYVSQLFADEANPPSPMVQGVLTRIGRYGHRTNLDVPFPAGVVVDKHANVYVSAWSIAPATGLAGPGTSGQVWRLRF